MNAQKLAGICGTVIALIVLAAAFYYVPPVTRSTSGQVTSAKPVEKTELPAARGPVVRDIPDGAVSPGAPAAPARGPVVRDIPQ